MHLRFLQLQVREVAEARPAEPSTWEEAVEHEMTLPPFPSTTPDGRSM